jgi:aryl-alcohol dehydrogenase-like predicted oxidoreductase
VAAVIDHRPLGRSGIHVHPLCLGSNVFGWSADERASFAVLDAYAAAGGNFIDSANVYSAWVAGNRGGESEGIIGRWLASRGVRDRMVVATKVGQAMPGQPAGLSADLVRRGVEASLSRLGIERIDLLYAHIDDPETPVEETLGAFDRLVREGLVRAIGASNFTAERLGASLDAAAREGLVRYEAVQPRYNLLDREAYEGPLEELCLREGLGVAPYYGVARGFLTGKYREGGPRPESPRAGGVLESYANPRGWAVLEAVERVAEVHGATPAQVALAWLMCRPSVTAPIASATSAEQVRELIGAAELSLEAGEIAELHAVGAPAATG